MFVQICSVWRQWRPIFKSWCPIWKKRQQRMKSCVTAVTWPHRSVSSKTKRTKNCELKYVLIFLYDKCYILQTAFIFSFFSFLIFHFFHFLLFFHFFIFFFHFFFSFFLFFLNFFLISFFLFFFLVEWGAGGDRWEDYRTPTSVTNTCQSCHRIGHPPHRTQIQIRNDFITRTKNDRKGKNHRKY